MSQSLHFKKADLDKMGLFSCHDVKQITSKGMRI